MERLKDEAKYQFGISLRAYENVAFMCMIYQGSNIRNKICLWNSIHKTIGAFVQVHD